MNSRVTKPLALSVLVVEWERGGWVGAWSLFPGPKSEADQKSLLCMVFPLPGPQQCQDQGFSATRNILSWEKSLGMVVHTYSSSTGAMEAKGLQVIGWHRLREILLH